MVPLLKSTFAKRTHSFPAMPSMIADWPPNPFVNNVTLDSVEKMKFVLLFIFLAPIRVLFVSFFASMAYVVALATLFDQDTLQTPLKGLRRKGKNVVATALIWAHFMAGFKVTVKGKRAPSWQAPILVLAPHTSFFDTLPNCVIGAPSVVGKKSLFSAPFIGTLLKLTLPIIVDRESKDSRKETFEKIKERAEKIMAGGKTGEEWPQVAIFPEGTCTNRTQLITFKPGAFYPKVPVQPICLKWDNSYPDSISWTWEGATVSQLLWVALSKLHHRLEVEYLPTYFPNDAERLDANLYARNVRAKMAECLGLPVSDYTLDDAPYLSMNIAPKLSNFWLLSDKLKKSLFTGKESMSELRHTWDSVVNSPLRSQRYHLSFKEFALFFQYDEDKCLQRLYNAFDWQCSGKIDLREFILTHYSKNAEREEFVNFAIKMFTSEKETIDEQDFVKLLRFPYGRSVKDCRHVYARLKSQSKNGIITQSDIVNLLKKWHHFQRSPVELAIESTTYKKPKRHNGINGYPKNGISLKH